MIRPFTPADLDSILEIEGQSFPKSPYDAITFLTLYDRYPNTFLIDEGEKGEVGGYMIYSPDGHIISLAVHSQQRRKGIGSRLMQKAVENLPVKRLWAEVRRSNRGAQAFYFHLGFRITGVVPRYYRDEDALIVEKKAP
jgi:ribosomal-protein-alanine N-acetyltransferase